MDFDYEIVPYRPEFKPQVLELQRELWSPNLDLNRAYFEWKHERNPYVPGPVVYLALHRGVVVGMRGFFGTRWEAGSPLQSFTGIYADDIVIAKGHRNRGLIPRMMRASFEELSRLGFEYLFSLSAGPVTHLSSLATGWRAAGSARPMCFGDTPWTGQPVIPRVLTRLRRYLPATMDRAFRSWSGRDAAEVTRSFGSIPGVSFELQPRPEAMSALVEQIGSDGRIRHVRDQGYFEWRFRNPLSRYGFLFHKEGYLVLQESASDYGDPTRTNVLDWEATNTTVLDLLLEAACRVVGRRTQLFIWSATLSQAKLELLAKRRFRLVPEQGIGSQRGVVLVRGLSHRPAAEWQVGGKQLGNLADWDLRMLYSTYG